MPWYAASAFCLAWSAGEVADVVGLVVEADVSGGGLLAASVLHAASTNAAPVANIVTHVIKIVLLTTLAPNATEDRPPSGATGYVCTCGFPDSKSMRIGAAALTLELFVR